MSYRQGHAMILNVDYEPEKIEENWYGTGTVAICRKPVRRTVFVKRRKWFRKTDKTEEYSNKSVDLWNNFQKNGNRYYISV